MNGFALQAFQDGLSAIYVSGINRSIQIRNGAINNWAQMGINATNAGNSQFKDLQVDNNGGTGIAAGAGCTVLGCNVQANGGNGIETGGSSVVSKCTAFSNRGLAGIRADSGSSIDSCAATGNMTNGISGNIGCVIAGCSVFNNSNNGIDAGSGATVRDCSAYFNTGHGINAGTASAIRECNAYQNSKNGINVSGDCLVGNNTCTANTLVGILATFNRNRIEANHCVGNGNSGITTSIGGNFVIRNDVRDPATPYSISNAGNVYGPIVVGGGVITTNNPYANFQY